MSTQFLDEVPEPTNFNPELAPFDLLVSELFLLLESTNSENKAPFASVLAKKTHIVEEFIKTWRTHFGNNIYPAVKLIFPNRDGRKYHIKDVALTRLVSKLLNLQPGLSDDTIIKNWKRTFQQKVQLAGEGERRNLGDLPLIIARIVLRRRDQNNPVKSSVTVDDVNDVLDKLTEKTQAADQVALLLPFVDKLTIPEVRFFFQIILKESMLSFFERSFFTGWHPDAYELYKVCDDMKKIFWLLTDPEKRLTPEQVCVQPMYKFIPQSSKKLEISYENLCKKMTVGMSKRNKDPKLVELYEEGGFENHFLIEEKLDGDRMLMHMVDGKFRWHTRRRRDYTLVYGENVHIGSLTKHLSNAFHENVKSIVLDGEMVAWDKERNLVLPFGTLRSAAIQEALKQFDVVDVYEGNNSWPLFIIFDILHLNGRDLTSLPLFYRKTLINKVVREVPHRFEVLEWVKAQTPADLKVNMQRIISEHNEGIMVKSFLLKYRVYSRDSTWVKVKPEYLENFGENLDLVVIGKIGKVKTSYMCGLRDEENEGCFKLFCLVANGFLNAVYRQIESKLCNFWVDYKKRKPPAELLEFGTKKPEHWIDPANLIVLEIKARSIEVTADTPYAAGSTLHNLWCRAVREDKGYEECILLQEYQELKLRYTLDIHKNQVVNRLRANDQQNSIYLRYNKVKRPKVSPASCIFQGLHFVVATDYKNSDTGEVIPNEEVKTHVKENGGTLELNPKQDRLHGRPVLVVGQNNTPRLKRWGHEGFDVIHPQWIYHCISRRSLVPIEPQFVQYSENETMLRHIQRRVDEFGDSYTVSPRTSRGYLLKLHSLAVPKCLTDASFAECVQEWVRAEKPLGRTLFAGLAFYVVAGGEVAEKAETLRICRRIVRFGGEIVGSAEQCQVVLVSRRVYADATLLRAVAEVRRQLALTFQEGKRLPYMVTDNYIDQSIEARELADPERCRVIVDWKGQ